MIQVKNLVKNYEGKVPLNVLKGVDFSIKKGEFLAIIGRSGSGKSTLLHQLSLLDHPTGGEIIIDGVNVARLKKEEKTFFRLKNLGYVFQEYALLPEFTALEAVALPLILLHKEKKIYTQKAADVLKKVGLKDRLDHYPFEMSGGEQQRVAIARAIVNSPKILFADEPCANLDKKSSEIVLQLLECRKTLHH